MTFPTHIRTKAEANAFAAELFPDHAIALARIKREKPGEEYPFFWIEQRRQDDLRALFDWLFDDKTRIYKRLRWQLFYDLAKRIIVLVNDNQKAVDQYFTMEFAAREYERRKFIGVMRGDGEGI